MMDSTTRRKLVALYPAIHRLDHDAVDDVLSRDARELTVPAGTPLFAQADPCSGFPLVLSGEVRVARGSPEGRELELYRVGPGELCVMSLSCLVGSAAMTADGTATALTQLVVLTPAGFDRWVAHEPFRTFVFGTFADRLADLMALTEAVAFQRLDRRLAQALLTHGTDLRTTHQALADELGTVREMITRLLKRFENAGWVRLAREHIEIVDVSALRALAVGNTNLA
jgi:CRP/FNR family transcriptional regulator